MTQEQSTPTRTSPKKMAKQFAKHLRAERPDYDYLKTVFKELRAELGISVPKKLPWVPTEKEAFRFYKAVWESKNFQNMIIVKTLLFTGIRVAELVSIQLTDVDLESLQIRVNDGKGGKDRVVPFPPTFKELLAMHIETQRKQHARYLFESSWKKKYTDRGIRKILAKYSVEAGLPQTLSPHKLRHFLFTWLKKQGVDDALIQPYSGHESRQSLEVYSRLSLADSQNKYNEVMEKFPIK